MKYPFASLTILCLGVVLTGCFSYHLKRRSELSYHRKEAKVSVARESITKQVVFQDKRLETIKDVAFTEDGVLVATLAAVLDLDRGFNERSRTSLVDSLYAVRLIDHDFNGRYAVFANSLKGAFLFDLEGKEYWHFHSSNTIISSGCADLDEDGQMEFFLGHIFQGVQMLESDGTSQWVSKGLNTWNLAPIYQKEQDQWCLAHSHASGKLNIVTPEGQSAEQLKIKGAYFSQFATISYPNPDSQSHLLFTEHGKHHIMQLNGEVVAKLPAPKSWNPGDVKATSFWAGGEVYYAVLNSYDIRKRSVLYIYNEQKKIIYQEMLYDDCEYISFQYESDSSSLYVGGIGKLYRYDFSILVK